MTAGPVRLDYFEPAPHPLPVVATFRAPRLTGPAWSGATARR